MTLNIVQWNIKGYLNNYNQLLLIIKKISPQILTLQETHLLNIKYLPIPVNYLIVHNQPTNRFGGTAILIHKSLQFSNLSVTSNKFDVSAINIESTKTLTIFSVYISPNKTFNLNDLSILHSPNNYETIITGDFNSWNQKWGSTVNNNRGNTLLKFLDQSDLVLLNDNSPTHFTTHNTFTHIDISFCSPALVPNSSWKTIKDLHGSDHFPIHISLLAQRTAKCHKRPQFKTQLSDWTLYNLSTHYHTNEYAPSENTNKEAANIRKILLQSAHKSIPQTTPKPQKHNVPWWSKTLSELKNSKNWAWRNLNNNINPENIILFKKANALFRRELRQSKMKATTIFTSEIRPSTPTSKIWANIRTFCGLNNNTTIHCLQDTQTGRSNTCKLEIANNFAQHWSKTSQDSGFSQEFITNKYKPVQITFNPTQSANQIEADITHIELLSALQSLKGNTPGHDRISYIMIKKSSNATKLRITQHFNDILNSHIPQSYKTSLIIPILKPNKNKTTITSYRPISLNSCIAKLLDKIIAKRLWWYVTNNNLLHQNQFGFKKGKSVTDCLIYADHLITESLSKRSHTSIISLDFSKAFDRIGVHAILDQANEWKLGPKIFNYIANFMSNRRIMVQIGHQISSTFPLFNGVPQGSPISVILFLIAYNRLCNILTIEKRINFTAYADDFHLIIQLNKQKNLAYNLDTLFQNIISWCNYSGAILSTEKCKHIHICRKHKCSTKIHTNNITIPTVNTIKMLGITFSNNYRWNSHITELATSLSKRLDIIKCLSSTKFNCNTHTLLMITKALVISKIDYGLFLYGDSPKSTLNKLKSKLNSAIRTALGAFRTTPIHNLLLEANIHTIENKFEYLTAKLLKTLINSSDTPLYKILKSCRKTRKRTKTVRSVFNKIVSKCTQLNLPFHPYKYKKQEPTRNLTPYLIDTSLNSNTKNVTNQSIYQQEFLKIKSLNKNCTFIYTDGSQSNTLSTYSITTENTVLKSGILPFYSSVLSAETIAILEAIQIIKTKRGKFIICSDSLSALKSISNPNNSEIYPSAIRSLLIKHIPKIRLLWVPGHSNITGNELADKTAKEAARLPLIFTQNFNIKDINSFLKHQLQNEHENLIPKSSNWYQQIYNKKHITDNYLKFIPQNSLTRLDQTKIIRLRLGHTKITKLYTIDRNYSSLCPTCQNHSPTTIEHILDSCQASSNLRRQIFHYNKPSQLLSNPNLDNMSKIVKFLKISNLYHHI
uniref:RNA-directed DNA polymerase from mobile element jockey n=1 Tax=Ceratitis capitata TaxID=7213 RepID=W8C2B6_CERCA